MHKFPAGLTAGLVAGLLAVAPAAAQTAEQAAAPTEGQAAPQTGEPGPAALAFVEQFSDDHLSGMLSRIGAHNEAMRALAEFDSKAVAIAFDAEIDEAVRQYGDQWARNMALAWEPLLTDAEMASLVELGADSPYADKYVASRDAAAASMAELSRDLFREILQQVLTGTVAVLSPDEPDPGKADNAAPAK